MARKIDLADAAAVAVHAGRAGLLVKGGAVAAALALILVIGAVAIGSVIAGQYSNSCLAAAAGPGADASVPLPNSDPDAKLDVTVASWNVLKSNSTSRVMAGIDAIADTGTDVIGLQELTPKLRAALQRDLDPVWGISGGNNAVQIIWRRDRLEAVSQSNREVFPVTRITGGETGINGSSAGPKWMQRVQFRAKTGATFAVINHHLLPTIETKGRPDPKSDQKVRLASRQMNAALAEADQLSAAGVPVVITGDHNIAAKADAKVKNPRFPHVLYAKHGIYSNWRTLGYPDNTGTQSRGRRLIDYVFATTATLAPTKQQILTTQHGSDHKPVVVDLSNARRLAATSNSASNGSGNGAGSSQAAPTAPPKATGTEAQQQITNARQIAQGVRAAGGDGHALFLALVTAVGESDLINVTYGDQAGPDSRGLFQQRNSWGTLAQRMNPVWAAGAFLLGPHQQGSGGLLQVPGWRELAPTAAIHKVQINADPNYYSAFEGRARDIARRAGLDLDAPAAGAGQAGDPALTSAVDDNGCTTAPTGQTGSCGPTQMAGENQGLTPDALLVLRCVAGTFTQVQTIGTYAGHQPDMSRAVDIMIPGDYASPAGRSLGLNIADWVRTRAVELGVDYVIFDQRIWSSQRAGEGWRSCGTAAAGCYAGPDDSAAHRDHVHVSVFGNQGTGFTSQSAGAGTGPQVGTGACPLDQATAANHRPGTDCNGALAYVQAEMSSPRQSWYRQCLALVMRAYGYSGGPPTAYAAAMDAQRANQLNLDRSNIPRGAVLYWDGRATGNAAGHVAIADGQGYIYSNDVTAAGKVDRVPEDFPETRWGQTFLGWSGPYFPNGVGGSR